MGQFTIRVLIFINLISDHCGFKLYSSVKMRFTKFYKILIFQLLCITEEDIRD